MANAYCRLIQRLAVDRRPLSAATRLPAVEPEDGPPRPVRTIEGVASANDLVGRWYGAVDGEKVGLEFLPDGRLAYATLTANGTQVMRLTYRVEGGELVTNQASAPREERTAFSIDGKGNLTLTFGGALSVFSR